VSLEEACGDQAGQQAIAPQQGALDTPGDPEVPTLAHHGGSSKGADGWKNICPEVLPGSHYAPECVALNLDPQVQTLGRWKLETPADPCCLPPQTWIKQLLLVPHTGTPAGTSPAHSFAWFCISVLSASSSLSPVVQHPRACDNHLQLPTPDGAPGRQGRAYHAPCVPLGPRLVGHQKNWQKLPASSLLAANIHWTLPSSLGT
jgi:hypothetical protein